MNAPLIFTPRPKDLIGLASAALTEMEPGESSSQSSIIALAIFSSDSETLVQASNGNYRLAAAFRVHGAGAMHNMHANTVPCELLIAICTI